ncbi:MAG: right-handed parallel beta-helix repeat-containing protein [Chloroflexota bacterium]
MTILHLVCLSHSRNTYLFFIVLTGLSTIFAVNATSSQAGQNGTSIGGNITANTTWTKAASPYVLTSTVTIVEDIILTIEPGTIIKAQNFGIILNTGATLNAVGTESEPIVFTSLLDDEIGGDTNGDGAASAPAPNNWQGIRGQATGSAPVNSSTLNLQYVTIRYAYGVTANGHLTLHDSTIEANYWSGATIAPAAGTSPNISIQRTHFLTPNGSSISGRPQIIVSGQPSQLIIQDNTFTTQSYGALTLTDVTDAQVSGNTITQNGDSSLTHVVILENVTSQVALTNNSITRSGDLTSGNYAGIVVRNGAPTVTNNTISGFRAALLMDGGYPEMIPAYSGNTFDGNYWIGVGVMGTLKSGTWTEAGGYPHFLWNSPATLEEDATLTIPPGTIIKSLRGHLILNARATLNAIGTESEPIILTSGYDDSVGGDSTQDGVTTVAEPNNWQGITSRGTGTGSVNASTLNLQHVTMRYAYTALIANGNLTLQDSTIEASYFNGVAVAPAAGESPVVSILRNRFLTPDSVNISGQSQLTVNGQPDQLAIQDNTFTTLSYGAMTLTGVSDAQVSGNTITQNGDNAFTHVVTLENVTSQVALTNNNITRRSGDLAKENFAGIVVRNGVPTLSNNTVSGFRAAALMDGGYPEMVPAYSGNTFEGNFWTGIGVMGTLKSGTWIEAGGYPHFLWNSAATLEEDATLTIPAGTIIKSVRGNLILGARATLNAIGTENEPIIFTSGYDDSVGGDSTNDGVATVATPNDWSGITGRGSGTGAVNVSNVNLQFVTIRYAYTALTVNGSLALQDSKIESNYADSVYIQPAADESPTILIQRTQFLTPNDGSVTGRPQIFVLSQPDQLTIQENTFAALYAAISLSDVNDAQLSGNTITQSSEFGGHHAIVLENATEPVSLSNNTITRSGNSEDSNYAGIVVRNGRPTLTNNTIRGFRAAVLIEGGYPEMVPAYSGNTFDGNTWAGVGISGNLSSGTWTNEGGYDHFIWNNTAVVPEGATLTIPAGTVIKSLQGSLTLNARAALNAVGTESEPIVFTSGYDDSVGGNSTSHSNSDGSLVVPEPNNWTGITGRGTGSGSVNSSTLNLQYVTIRYAYAGVTANGNLTLHDSTVEFNFADGAYVQPSLGESPTVSIQRSTLRHNGQSGINIAGMPMNLALNDNAIYSNSRFGVNNSTTDGSAINATGVWWGDANGPEEETNNPDGEGDKVNGNIDFNSWLTTKPDYVPPELPDVTQDPPDPITPPANIPTLADTFEGDNECTIAATIATDESNQEHNFDRQGDIDWIKFEATAGQSYRVEVQTRANSVADVNLEVYDRCDGPVTHDFDETFTPGVRLDLNPIQSGTLYLKLSNYDPNIFGADAVYSVSVRQLKSTSDAKGAAILLEGRLKLTDRLQPNIHNVVQRTYQLFKSSGYSDDDIQYLSTDESAPGYDGPATTAALENAITTWAADRVGQDQPLTIYLMDHGHIDKLYLDEPNGERVSPEEMNSWLTALEEKVSGVKSTIIIEACNSGSFIMGAQSVSKVGRLVITSTNVQNVAYASAEGAQFSDRFLTSLREGYGLANSFWDARLSVRRLYTIQDPWIDANGNGIPNEEDDGGQAISDHDPNTSNQPADTWAPYIVRAEAPKSIDNGIGTIRAEVRDNKGVAKVWAAVYGPSYDSPESSEELVPEDVPTATFSSQGSNIFSAEYDGFTEAGTYQIALYAEDNDGLKARLMVLEVQNSGGDVYLPLVRQ